MIEEKNTSGPQNPAKSESVRERHPQAGKQPHAKRQKTGEGDENSEGDQAEFQSAKKEASSGPRRAALGRNSESAQHEMEEFNKTDSQQTRDQSLDS